MKHTNRRRTTAITTIFAVTLLAVVGGITGLRSEPARERNADACMSIANNICLSGTASWAGTAPVQAISLAAALPRVDVSMQYAEGPQCAADPLAMSVALRRECGITTPVDTSP